MDSPQTVLGGLCWNLSNKLCVVCMRPEKAMELGSTMWNRCLVSGLPTDNPLFYFGTVKNNHGLYELDQKRPCVVCLKLLKWMA